MLNSLDAARARAQELLDSGAETTLAIIRTNVEGEQVDLSSYLFYDLLER